MCIGFGEASFLYAPLDRSYFRPVHFSPAMQTDVVKRVTAGLTSLPDPRIKEALEGPLNTAVNDRIEALRSGRYNIISLVVAKGIMVSITPTEHQSEDLLVWMPRAFSDRLLDIFAGGKPQDTIYVLSTDGSMRPLDTKSRPKWLRSDNLYEHAWSDSGKTTMLRLKKMERSNISRCPGSGAICGGRGARSPS